MSCTHPSDAVCSRCPHEPDNRTDAQREADQIEAVACGHLWWGGEAGRARYRELMAERDVILGRRPAP